METFDRSRAVWRKSTRSNGSGGDCVEFAQVDGVVGMRDSKDPSGPVLVFSAESWTAFVAGIKAGGFQERS
jgi:hypothetical protein